MMFLLVFWIFTSFLLIGYGIVLMLLRHGLGRLVLTRGSHRPSVTVVVPCHNEAANLPRLLERLSQQTYSPPLLQIALVDDRSEDGTWETIRSFAATNPHAIALRIDHEDPDISPKKNAIARAIAASSGEIIVTTDADTFPGPRWIETLVQTYDQDNIGMVLGYAPYRTDGPYGSLFHCLLALEYFSLAAVASGSAGFGRPVTCNGANLSYRRLVFEQVGGYGKNARWLSGDDDLFLHHVRQSSRWNVRYAIDPETAVFNNPPRTLAGWIRQRIRFSSKHPAYPPVFLVVLLAIWCLNICLLIGAACAVFRPTLAIPWLVGLAIKALLEISFLSRAQRILENRKLLRLYPLIVLPHILYVVFIPILGQILRKRW